MEYSGVGQLEDTNLGLLSNLPGIWFATENVTGCDGTMSSELSLTRDSYNQQNYAYCFRENVYCDMLEIRVASKNIPGMEAIRALDREIEQSLVALEYHQSFIHSSKSESTSNYPTPMHSPWYYESGFWVHMLNDGQIGPNVAKLNTTDSGDKVFALGSVIECDAGIYSRDCATSDGGSVKHSQRLHASFDFSGKDQKVPSQFPQMLRRLKKMTPFKYKRALKLSVATNRIEVQGIRIPFYPVLASNASIETTVWIYELDRIGGVSEPRFLMQYLVEGLFGVGPKRSGKSVEIQFASVNTLVKSPV
jgi:hypothetical protein